MQKNGRRDQIGGRAGIHGRSLEFSPQERDAAGIKTLPGSLYAAIVEAERSAFLRRALGDHIFQKLIENKKIEWDRYRVHVSRYEIDKYLAIL